MSDHAQKPRSPAVHPAPTALPPGAFVQSVLVTTAGVGLREKYMVAGVTAASRVFASISEYGGNDADTQRFLGSARLTMHNVVPLNGWVQLWYDVEWEVPINIRIDLLVIPAS